MRALSLTESIKTSTWTGETVPSDVDAETLAAAERLRSGRWGYRLVKRAFDIAFSLAVLVGLSWLFLLVAVAIKLDDPEGPAIFAQTRVGRDGREFRMYKFRSMVSRVDEVNSGLRVVSGTASPTLRIIKGSGLDDTAHSFAGQVGCVSRALWVLARTWCKSCSLGVYRSNDWMV